MIESGVFRDLVIRIISCKVYRFANTCCSSRLIFAPISLRAGKHFDKFLRSGLRSFPSIALRVPTAHNFTRE